MNVEVNEPAAAFVARVLDEHIPLGAALGIKLASIDDGAVSLRMPLVSLAMNHVGTAYAGALYTLAELTAGVTLGLIGRPDLIPVLVASALDFTRPGLEEVTCTASPPVAREQLKRSVDMDRRHLTLITVACRAGDETCCTARFEYRWVSLSVAT